MSLWKLYKLRIAEVLLLLFLILYIVWIFRMGSSKDVDMSVIADAITAQCELKELSAGDANALKQYFSRDASAYEGYLFYTSEAVMNVDQLLIVKTTDSKQLEELEDSVNAHLEKQLRNFHGYGTDQEELLQNAVVLERGDYFFYGVSDQVQQWEDVFLSCIQ